MSQSPSLEFRVVILKIMQNTKEFRIIIFAKALMENSTVCQSRILF